MNAKDVMSAYSLWAHYYLAVVKVQDSFNQCWAFVPIQTTWYKTKDIKRSEPSIIIRDGFVADERDIWFPCCVSTEHHNGRHNVYMPIIYRISEEGDCQGW